MTRRFLRSFPSPLLLKPLPEPQSRPLPSHPSSLRSTSLPPTLTYHLRNSLDLISTTSQTLSDKLAALESTVRKLLKPKPTKTKTKTTANYAWKAEINTGDGIERIYNWSAKITGGGEAKKDKKIDVKNYKWSSEIKGRGENASVRKYSVEVIAGKQKEKKEDHHRTVEIEDISNNPGALVLKRVFAKRAGALNAKGKKKVLSLQDAAILIQTSFRAYLIRRSKALRGLRELAVAKNKLKELRKLFNNFSYRRRIAHDAEECQKFVEKIIVVLLTVDAIEGVDGMIRAAKRSMVDELEAMLDVVDPQPAGGRSLSIRRRTFDLPTGGIQKEITAGVAQVVKMLNEEENGTEDSTFEACL